MSDQLATLYRIVFKGEYSFEFEADEVRENLRRLCRFDDAALDLLFSGEPTIIKDKIPLEIARKYKAALDKTGAICSMEELPNSKRPEPPARIELATGPATEQPTIQIETAQAAAADPAVCPKCGAPKDPGPTCPACHVFYAKYEQMLARKQAIERGESPAPARPGQAPAPAPSAGNADDGT